jgi:hypothetical protein
MSIKDLWQKIKGWGDHTLKNLFLGRFSNARLPELSYDIFLVLALVLVAFGSFGLGRLSKIEGSKVPVMIEHAPETTAKTFSANALEAMQGTVVSPPREVSSGQLVGSKSGNKYHYPWCSSASRIVEGNRRYFASKEEAERAGYTPAANCKGL